MERTTPGPSTTRSTAAGLLAVALLAAVYTLAVVPAFRFRSPGFPGAPLPSGVKGVRSGDRPERPSETHLLAPGRLERLSRAYLGLPYRLDPLGEAQGPDRDPLFTRHFADCQTLVEQVMAEAVASHVGGIEAATRLVRYRGSGVRLANRHHYCIPDWLEHPWPARDVTSKIAGTQGKQLRRHIDRTTLLAGRGARVRVPVQTVTTDYLPRARVPGLEGRIPGGTIAVFVVDRPGIVAGHVGFLFRKNGRVVLRHASQRRKQVVDQPLTEYLQQAPRKFLGMKVLQPDLAGLQRASRQ